MCWRGMGRLPAALIADPALPLVFLDIATRGQPVGRIEVVLVMAVHLILHYAQVGWGWLWLPCVIYVLWRHELERGGQASRLPCEHTRPCTGAFGCCDAEAACEAD